MGKWGRGKGRRKHQRSKSGEWLGGRLGILSGGQMFKELTIKDKVNLK